MSNSKTMRSNIGMKELIEKLGEYKHWWDAVFEIIHNAIEEGALTIQIFITVNSFAIIDDGRGMNEEMIQAFADIFKSIKRKEQGGEGYHGAGSWAWVNFAKSIIVRTKQCNKPVCQFGFDIEEIIAKNEVGEFDVTEGGKRASDPTTESFTVQECSELRRMIDAEDLIRELPNYLPMECYTKVYVNGRLVAPRNYDGKPIYNTKKIPYNGGQVDISQTIYVIPNPTRYDRVYLNIQGRKMPMAVLAEYLPEVPEVYLSKYPRVAGEIRADYLAPFTGLSRNIPRDLESDAFDLLIEYLREFAKKIEEVIQPIQKESETGADKEIAREAIISFVPQLKGNLELKTLAQEHNRPRCFVCTENYPKHYCKPLRSDICLACCKNSWNKNSSIDGCSQSCRFYGQERRKADRPDDGDTDVLPPPPGGAEIPLRFSVHGLIFTLRMTDLGLGSGPSSLDAMTRIIFIHTGHALYKRYTSMSKKISVEWVRILMAVELSNFFGLKAGIGWEYAMGLLATDVPISQ